MSDPYAEVLKLSETQLRDAVARLGNHHPEVLAMLNQYIAILRQCGQAEKADKLAVKAQELKGIIESRAQQATSGAAPAAAPSAASAPIAATPTPAPAPAQTGAPSNGGGAAATSPALSEEEEALKKAEERAKARAAAAAAMEEKARAARAEREAQESEEAKNAPPDIWGDNEIDLYDSDGKHIAVAYKGALYLPDGKNLARWDDGLEAFLDRKGWYLGQIVQGNRLARDLTWQFRHMNFGDRGNEGNRSGFSNRADESRTLLESGWEDVEFSND